MFDRHPFHPKAKRARPFQRGDFKYILLQYLKEQPSYGYEIIQALQERFHSFYAPSPGTVYPTLQMLEEMGYVTAEEQEGKKIYTITADGRRFLEEQKEFEEKIKNQIKDWCNPDNVDDMRETMSEFESLAMLLREKARTADAEKLSRIRKAIATAYKEISKD